MTNLSYVKHEPIRLKDHPDFNVKWLQDRIAEEPSILGLGDLAMIDRERRQERAGRLDLLLADPEQDHRYEVELMLGATDESHIIRCIEYPDIERRRRKDVRKAWGRQRVRERELRRLTGSQISRRRTGEDDEILDGEQVRREWQMRIRRGRKY